ncbi:unnamed protein product [Moneuplotes crassus]|uniref:Uncharacterized protein n=1 Tax=Euplotes crassus TaxID=5936 RepID=A0AAD1XMM1_EUPCR|nr:unnamed protein product [Moneuplotes crassus]
MFQKKIRYNTRRTGPTNEPAMFAQDIILKYSSEVILCCMNLVLAHPAPPRYAKIIKQKTIFFDTLSIVEEGAQGTNPSGLPILSILNVC